MTDDTLVLRPEVVAFVEEVRRHLADLDEETRDDLLDGLDADLAEQLADGATLGDPAGYAAELRSAAGLPEPRRRRRHRVRFAPTELLDEARARFLTVAESPRFRPAWELLVTLRPAWWVARAWVAVTALDVAAGSSEHISVVPTLGVPGLGPLVLVAAIVVSTLIGLGRLWPASVRASQRRFAVLALNAAAVATPLFLSIPVPAYLSADQYAWYGADDPGDYYRHGLFANGQPVTNIFAYDAAGQPLAQVQLVDQDGRPLSIRLGDAAVYDDDSEGLRVPCPARNGGAAVTNAFPFAYARTGVEGRCTAGLAARAVPATPPLASLPPITLPGR